MPPFDFDAILAQGRVAARPRRKMNLRVNEPIQVAPAAPLPQPIVPDGWGAILDEMLEPPINPFAVAMEPVVAKAKPEAPNMEIIPFTERSTRLPRFKMNYESQEEIQLRLNNTIAMVYDEYVYIAGVGTYRCDRTGARGNGIMCAHGDGRNSHVVFATDGLDLRSPPTGYISIGDRVYYMTRPPVRVYKQGINRENTHWIRVWDGGRADPFDSHNIREIVRGLNERPVINWSEDLFVEGIRAVRLSDRVAVRKRSKLTFEIMYKNKAIGKIVNNKAELLKEPTNWCRRSLEAVGLL